MRQTAQLWSGEDGRLICRFPYDPDFIDKLKATFSGRSKKWDPVTRTWSFDPPSRARLIALLETRFVVEDATNTLQKHQQEFLAVLQHFPPDLLPGLFKQFYRAMALVAHPDRGGSTRLMQLVNEAAEKLK